MTQPQECPVVKQCQDSSHWQYGSVAVKNATTGKWGVMSPINGGHWADDAEVESWANLVVEGYNSPDASTATK